MIQQSLIICYQIPSACFYWVTYPSWIGYDFLIIRACIQTPTMETWGHTTQGTNLGSIKFLLWYTNSWVIKKSCVMALEFWDYNFKIHGLYEIQIYNNQVNKKVNNF